MASSYICDYCGEPIERDHVYLSAIPGRFWKSRDFHETPCLGIVNDLVEAASGDRPSSAASERSAAEARRREEQARWKSLTMAQREHMLIEKIGEGMLTVSGLVKAVRAELGEDSVYYSDMYVVVKRLYLTGELGRKAEPYAKTKTRYRYFRKAPAGPIVELERAFAQNDEAA